MGLSGRVRVRGGGRGRPLEAKGKCRACALPTGGARGAACPNQSWSSLARSLSVVYLRWQRSRAAPRGPVTTVAAAGWAKAAISPVDYRVQQCLGVVALLELLGSPWKGQWQLATEPALWPGR